MALVRGQRCWKRSGTSAVVLDAADGQAVVELATGAVELVAERELIAAENVQSVKERESVRSEGCKTAR
jgi:hypothetical protein